jgi:hypothetical protein
MVENILALGRDGFIEKKTRVKGPEMDRCVNMGI